MNKTYHHIFSYIKGIIDKRVLLFCLISFLSLSVWAQEPEEVEVYPDTTQTGYSLGKLKSPEVNSIVSKYTYDPKLDRYVYTQSVGEFNIDYPIILTPKEYERLVLQQSLKSYYKEKIDAVEGKKEGSGEAKKNLNPGMYVNSGFFKSVFGSNTISVNPQGSVEIDLGILYSRQDNPIFSPRNRSSFSFDFDQRINLSMLAKIGTRLQVTANYDTESTFDFQNAMKIEFMPLNKLKGAKGGLKNKARGGLGNSASGGDDSIIKKIEVGNVSMPLNSSLITGAQSLFGVKTELQFGKTTIQAVFSEQKSDTKTVVAQGGGTLEEFDIFIRDYDENRHFFLAQYFRDHYEEALETYPYLNTQGLQITRLEVWVTNRSNSTQNVRNIVGLQDIGESDILGIIPSSNVNVSLGAFPDNGNNDFDPTNIGGAGSLLTEDIREVANIQQGILVSGANEGKDYSKIENARKLIEGQEYTFNSELGYLSLTSRLNNDEVLGAAFQYTVGGKVYQVGEFANDGVNATEVETNGDGDVTNVINSNLVVKLLKSSVTFVDQPIWDLMMKNVYDTGAFQLSQDDFRLNIFYNETSPLNFITPVDGNKFSLDINGDTVVTGGLTPTPQDELIQNNPLLRVFSLDKLNFNNDPQTNGDGFFDFVPGITVLPENGKIIFPKVEPFGEYLFELLGGGTYDADNSTYNDDQKKYVYDVLYKSTKTAALEEIEKNKFQIKGKYKGSGGIGGGIPIGSFNVPRGSVKVTAGGRVLQEGIDYTVNYQLGTVQILDESLKNSNTPIQVSTENNAVFGQQTKRFMGLNIEHKFSEDFVLAGTLLNLNERPITQKANLGTEPTNNTIFGINGNYTTELPFLTRFVNHLPNIDTDVPSKLSVRGEVAFLAPGSPKRTNFGGEATSYIDDFEGSQTAIDLKSPQSWFLSSRPVNVNDSKRLEGSFNIPGSENKGIENGWGRAHLNWYTIDPIFYSSQKPSGISEEDMSDLYTSRVFINELFPNQNLVQGQISVLNTLDLAYYPSERGAYNFDPTLSGTNNVIADPENTWAGITRQLTTTDLEQANVEYIEFWLQDPFQNNPSHTGGSLVFNLGNISEDVLKDGRKQYENGLPKDGDITLLKPELDDVIDPQNPWVVPLNQSLIYAFDSVGEERTNQDVGYDGYDDVEELKLADQLGFNSTIDPSKDNYTYFLGTDGDVFERYKNYNGVDGNSPDAFSDTNRAGNTQPDVEDVNRDNTMNTIDSYYEYELTGFDGPSLLGMESLDKAKTEAQALLDSDTNNILRFITDVKKTERKLPNGSIAEVRWYQVRIPVEGSIEKPINGISDLRSARFFRTYLKGFSENVVLRFGSLDLVRSDWRQYDQTLHPDGDESAADFSIGVISEIENSTYNSPPGIEQEELFNNNTVVKQNEQALVLNVCGLEQEQSKAVYKNISLDMRQYKNVRMFMHAESGDSGTLGENELVGFIRMGNDITQNYYQIEVPLEVSINNSSSVATWPSANEITFSVDVLSKIKAQSIKDGDINSGNAIFYDVVGDEVTKVPIGNEFTGYTSGQQRVAIKGNPNFGDIRALMVGVKNGTTSNEICGEVWFNELRLSGLDTKGGWAAILNMDSNVADFANVTATGRMSTAGFGGIEQGPNERSREDVKQYDVVTSFQLGQLFPKKWGLQIPFNYAQSAELVTPEYDQQYKDIKLQDRLDAADTEEDRKNIKEQSEDFTKRRSINFIGVKKSRAENAKPNFFDIENFTFNYSFNESKHRDFEIENLEDKTIRTGANYAYGFKPLNIEPFAGNDSIFTGRYWRLLKDFNLNLMPSSITINSDINRQFNKQKFRNIDLGGGNIGIEELFRRNYTTKFQYTINYNLTKSLQLNFTAGNDNIVRNYFKDDLINGEQDPNLDIWDGFFDLGDPNRQSQQLGMNYSVPINKIPILDFVKTDYQYTGNFEWQKSSDAFSAFKDPDTGGIYDLGNTIQNASTHNINGSLDMNKFYKKIGLVKKKKSRKIKKPKQNLPGMPSEDKKEEKDKKDKKTPSKTKKKLSNIGIDVLTSVKKIQFTHSVTNGTFLPGYTRTPGFIGTLKPSLGYTFGSQRDIRQDAARKGWLTRFPDFNQQYNSTQNKNLSFSVRVQPEKSLKIDVVADRQHMRTHNENYRIDTVNNQLEYIPLSPNTYGNFSISTVLLKTAFSKSDENQSEAFNQFRTNRLEVARRLALQNGVDVTNNLDSEGYPLGFGKTNQSVLLPSFLSAYTGKSSGKVKLGALRDIPAPNWDLKYTGFMKFKWFKKHFKRFSITHGYRSSYTINQFRTNLDYSSIDYSIDYLDQPENVKDQSGNYKNETLYGNVTLSEFFSPLARIDFEMKNSIKILLEIQKERLLSLSFDNNLLTENQTYEYTLGLGYRIKDLKIRSKLAGPKKVVVSDLNMKADISVAENKTIVRYLDLENNQITSGRTIWSLKYSADYAFSKYLNAIFFFDYAFSDYAISTAFPLTTIRSGFTIRYSFGN